EAATGTLKLSGANTSTGAFRADAGAALNFSGGTQSLMADSAVTGDGAVTFSGGTIAVLGGYAVNGLNTVSGGMVDFRRDAGLRARAVSGGPLGGTGTVTVAGLLTWTGGTMNGGGRTVAAGGMAISGTAGKTLSNRTLDNAGTATWTGTGNISMGSGAVWNN